MSDIKYIDLEEFVEQGFLQEANRRFFHPLGLALEVTLGTSGDRITGIWDYRDDPEGIVFADGAIDPAKIDRVEEEAEIHRDARAAMLQELHRNNWIVQQPGHA